MADQTDASAFALSDGVQQFVGSTFDASFTAGTVLNAGNTSAIEGLSAGAYAIGGTLLIGGIVIGSAQDGVNGGVKNAVTGIFAMEGAEVGAAYGVTAGGLPGAILGTIAGGFALNVFSSFAYNDFVKDSTVGPGDELPSGFLYFQNNPGAALGAATFGAATTSAVPYSNELLQYEQMVSNPALFNSLQDAITSINSVNQTIADLNSNYTLQYGSTPFNDYGLSAAGLQTAGNTPSQLGDGTSPGTLSDIAQEYLNTNTVFNDGTTPFNDYGLSNAGLQTAGTIAGQVGTDNGNGIGSGWANPPMPAYDIPSSSGSQDGSVFSAGAMPYNSYSSTTFTDAYGNTYATQQAADQGQDNLQDQYDAAPTPTINDSSYNGNDYDGGAYSGTDYASNAGGYSGGGYSGGGGYGYGPVVLDVAGKGVNIAQLYSSNTYEDVTGSGYKNLTAWAGVGNGVLFIDPTGAGQLTQANQIIFTKWDPGATSDMQALLDVFDTNHDGSLDSGDTDFSKFFVMVTNANGTETAMSLAALGITSISLNANATSIALPDGSSINGETTFSITNPSTGVTTTNVAATVTLAIDPYGYVVATTATANADGSEAVANVADHADGSLAYERILNTSSNGLSKTLTNLNSGGVVTTIQIDNTVVNGDGSTTETLTNFAGGAIQTNGELTSAGTTGSEELNSTTTTTSANGGVVTILRDQVGGGWTTQKEVDTTNADGSTSIVVSNLNPDGSASNVTTTSVSSNGLTRTVTSLVDGLAADSTMESDATVVNGSTRTETVTDSVGTTTTSLITTVTQTAANSVMRTITSDLTDGTTLDLTSVSLTVTNSDGSTTTTLTDKAANGALLDETVTQLDASGLLKMTSIDSTGSTNAGAPVFDKVVSDNTVVNGDGSRTETVTTISANGTQLSQTVTNRAASGAARTVAVYGNGDGKETQSQTVTVSGGTTTDTVENLNGDGSLVNETVTATSNGGLSKTISADATGAGTAAAPVFDHITTDITTSSGGISTENVIDYGAAISAGDEIDRTQTVISANGLTTTIYSAITGGSLAGGTWDQITTNQTTVNADASLTETSTVTNGAGHNLETIQESISANRQLTTTTTTLGTTGLVKTVETLTTESNGTVQDQVVKFDQQGDVTAATVTTSSADDLTKTIQHDVQGQTAATYAASGLAFDSTTSDTTVINADGSRIETINATSRNATLLSTTNVLTSANGLLITTTQNPYATSHYASKETDATVLNTDGSTSESISNYSYSGSLIDQTTTTTSASGLSTTTLHDLNGDGVTDQSTTDVTTINANGSQTEVVTDYTGGTGGSTRDMTSTTSGVIVQGAGLETTIIRQSNGSVPTYQVETILPAMNGTVTDTTRTYALSGGPLLLQTTVTTSANGLVKTTGTAVDGDTSNDFWTTDATVLNTDGSHTVTVDNYNKAALISETVTTTSGNGLVKTTKVDANGALSGTNPVFNSTTSDTTVLNSDGSRTETILAGAANGTTTDLTVTTTSADQQKVVINRYLNQAPTITIDQSATVQTQANGSITDTISSFGATHNLLGTVVKTKSADGLATTTVYEDASNAVLDTQSDTTNYDSNGDGGTIETFEDADDSLSGKSFTTSRSTQVSGNDQNTTIALALTGVLASTNPSTFSVTTDIGYGISDAGQTTETTADFANGTQSPVDWTTTVTSANQLTTTISTALGNANPYIIQQKSVLPDGSKSEMTTYYDPASLSVIEAATTIHTSYDGKTTTTTTAADYDLVGQSFDTYTPAFAGSGYNNQTETFVDNANGTTTDTRTGTGSFGASSYTQIISAVINSDSSLTTTTLNEDGSGVLGDQIVADISPDGLVKSYAYDTTGKETIGTLDLAAAAIASGATLPTSMLGTDIIESDATTLNSDGSKTEVVKTAYGNSFANQRSLTTTQTSANALVTTTFVDNDGSGINEQFGTVTQALDGSETEVYNFYSDTSGTQVIDSMTVGSTLLGTDTYNMSANGLVTTLTTSSGIIDTTVDFAEANGSYEFSRTITAGSQAAGAGDVTGSASHFVDANGIDAWSWNNGSGSSGTITVDLTTEKQDNAIANEIYQTLLGRPMDDAETQYLAQFITNGVLNREALAFSIVNTTEYQTNFLLFAPSTPYYTGFDIFAALENALGRLPTAEEMATFDQSNSSAEYATSAASIQAFIPAAVAIAQYAMDQGNEADLTVIDPNQNLVAPAAEWINPANTAVIKYSGTYSYSGFLVAVDSGTVVVNGSNNVIIAYGGSVTAAGFNNSIDVSDYSSNPNINVSASNASILIEDSNIATVTGNNDQIAQVGPTELNLTSGVGDVVYVTSGSLVTNQPYYAYSYSITNASNASITLALGVGTASAPAVINGSGDTIALTGTDDVTVTGSGDVINVLGSNDTITVSNATINVAAGVIGLTLNGTGNTSVNAAATTTVIESFGSTSLVQVGNNFYLDSVGNGAGPELKYAAVPFVAGQFGPPTPIAAEQTASGYEVAFQFVGTDLYTVWSTDSSGNYTANLIGEVSGTSAVFESFETSFHQDLNGDGVIGLPSGTTVIESSGSTSLLQVGTNYYLDSNTTSSDPSLEYGGVAVVAGQFGAFVPIGAEQTATGYEIVWKNPGANQYMVWTTDSNGDYLSTVVSLAASAGPVVEALESSFHQDLNGDGTIGLPANTTLIESSGATSLVQVGTNFYLDNSNTGTGPELEYGGTPFVAGQFGPPTPIAVEQTASGYEVAFQFAGTNQYTVWSTDGNGNYIANLIGEVSGTSLAFESFEASFHEDLNGDGIIGPKVIESFGSTTLVQAGQNFYLDSSSGTGPELEYQGAPFVAGQFGPPTPIAAEQTATGYEVALHFVGEDDYTVWSTDSNGNYIANLIGAVSGISPAFESFEASFHEDLNGDGVISPSDVIESFGSTSLVQQGNNFYLENASNGTGPELEYGGTAFVAGQFGPPTPIAAEQTASGYEVAFQFAGTNQYTVWSTDSNGNYIANLIGEVAGTSTAFESFETSFHQDLNGDGIIGLPPNTWLIESSGSTSLVKIGNNFYLDNIATGMGPELEYQGVPFVAGQFGAPTPIAVEQTATGYEVAIQFAGSNQYTVWSTDSNGNYTANVIGEVAGTTSIFESFEAGFHQDLNGDGMISPADVIESFGSTSLVQQGNNFYFDNVASGIGPELDYQGAPFVAGQFGPPTPIAVEQTASGYEVAIQFAGSSQYTVWSTDSNGNYLSNVIGEVAGTSSTFESFETSFHEDLNGDGVITPPDVIETSGSTSLVQQGNNFYLDNISSGTGPELEYAGAPFVAGQFGPPTPIAVEQTATGYEVAIQFAGSSQYTVWSTDSNGNYITNLIGEVSGTSIALEAFEPSFHQDLNGDGIVGPQVIESFGSTTLVQAGQNFYLDSSSGGTGPELQYNGSPFVAGQFGPPTPIAAEQTSSGYEVAFQFAGSSQYTVWSTDSNGNYTANLIGEVAGNSTAFESFETSFQQDLNGDGVVGVANVVNGDTGNNVLNGGNGTAILVGNGGYDTYQVGRGSGLDRIVNGTGSGGTPQGELDIGTGVATNQLWLQRSGNDLLVDIMGTHDQADIANWYGSNAGSQLQHIVTSGGSVLDSQINQLVQAMATYSATNTGFDPTAVAQAPNDPALQSAISTAWH